MPGTTTIPSGIKTVSLGEIRGETPSATLQQDSNWSLPSNYGQLVDAAKQTATPKASQYQLAVDLAYDKYADDPNVTTRQFKNTVDEIFDSMDAGVTAAEFRGENPFTQSIEGLKNKIDDLNLWIGNGLDLAFDSVVGTLAENLVSKEAGEKVRNWFDGEQASMVPDILEDILIGAIPGVGIPAVIGKNLVQRSDDLYEGMTGQNSVTGQKLSGLQSAAKAGEAFLGSGLAALPAIGKVAGKLNKAKKVAEEPVQSLLGAGKEIPALPAPGETAITEGITPKVLQVADTSKALPSAASSKILQPTTIVPANGFKNAVSNVAKNGKAKIVDVANKGKDKIVENVTDKYRNAGRAGKAIGNEAIDVADEVINIPDIVDDITQNAPQAKRELKSPGKFFKDAADNVIKENGLENASNLRKGAALAQAAAGTAGKALALPAIEQVGTKTIPGVGLAATDAYLANMAETGDPSFWNALGNVAQAGTQDGNLSLMMIAPFLVGTGKAGRMFNRNVVTGLPQGLNKGKFLDKLTDNLGYQGQRASAIGKLASDLEKAEQLQGNEFSPEETLARIQSYAAR